MITNFVQGFTDDKREKRKSKTTKQHPKGASSLSDASYVQVRRSASHKSNTKNRKPRPQSYRRRESTSSTHSLKSPQITAMTSASKSRRSSSIHSRRSSVSVQIDLSSSPSATPMNRRSSGNNISSGVRGKANHSKSPSMSSVGSNRSTVVDPTQLMAEDIEGALQALYLALDTLERLLHPFPSPQRNIHDQYLQLQVWKKISKFSD